jgi:hypothetical protein
LHFYAHDVGERLGEAAKVPVAGLHFDLLESANESDLRRFAESPLLWLTAPSCSFRDLRSVAHHELVGLVVAGNPIDPQTLGALPTQLQFLGLAGTPVDDLGCRLLAIRCEALLMLSLQLCDSVTGDAVASLRDSNLYELWINRTNLGDDSMTYIARIPSLRVLQAMGTPTTDDGVAALADSPNLAVVLLSGTTCGDRSLEALAHLPSLRLLQAGSNATSAGRARFRERRPDVELDGVLGY